MAVVEIPIEPFSKWLDAQVIKAVTPNSFCSKIGLNTTRLNEYRSGITRDTRTNAVKKRTMIRLSVVDKCATLAGVHISEIYPDYFDWPCDEVA